MILTILQKLFGGKEKKSFLETQEHKRGISAAVDVGAYDELGVNQAPQTAAELSRALTKRLDMRQSNLRSGTLHVKADYLGGE